MCVKNTVHTCHKSKCKAFVFSEFLRIKCASLNYKHPHLSVILIFKEQCLEGFSQNVSFQAKGALYRGFLLRQQLLFRYQQTSLKCRFFTSTLQLNLSFCWREPRILQRWRFSSSKK